MILTVTLNPLLERRLFFDSIKIGRANRAISEEYKAGGKGINVSRQLNYLNENNLAFTFIGGCGGKIFRQILESDKINYTAVSTKSDLRSATIIIENRKKNISTFFGANSQINEKEVGEFLDKLDKIIRNCSMVIFSGSSPNSLTDEIFPAGIKIARKYDKLAFLDTYGQNLKDCLIEKPFAIHNNVEEIESSLNIKLETEQDKIDYLNYIYGSGIKINILTNGPKPAYAANFDFHYRINIPEVNVIDPTGSGDSLVAGIAYGFSNASVFLESVKLAFALGIKNACSMETCTVNMNEAGSVLKEIEIVPIGKKMKLINDSPNY